MNYIMPVVNIVSFYLVMLFCGMGVGWFSNSVLNISPLVSLIFLLAIIVPVARLQFKQVIGYLDNYENH